MPKIVDRAQQRKQIAEQALAAFIEEGIHAFSLSAFLKAHAIPKGRFYHYFDSKEALLFAATQLLVERYLTRFESEVDWQADLATKLSVAHAFYLEDCADHRKKQRFVFDVCAHFIPHNSDEIQAFNRQLYQSIYQIVAAIIDDEIAKQRIKPESAALVPTIVATTDGLLMQSLIVEDLDLRQALLQSFTTLQAVLSY